MAVESIGAVTATSLGTSITPSTTANTKGSWVQLIASSTFAAVGIAIIITNVGGSSAVDYLIDIGIGGEGAETAVVANIPLSGHATIPNTHFVILNVSIAASSRVSARCQANGASSTAIQIAGQLLGTSTDNQGDNVITTYGAVIADSGGVQLDPGAVAHTKGSYVEIEDSTTDDIDYLTIVIANKNNTARTSGAWLLDIATGAAASETVVVSNLLLQTGVNNDYIMPQSLGPFPVTIPSGTRLSARVQSSITDATDRLLDVFLFGTDAGGTVEGGGGAHFHASL